MKHGNTTGGNGDGDGEEEAGVRQGGAAETRHEWSHGDGEGGVVQPGEDRR